MAKNKTKWTILALFLSFCMMTTVMPIKIALAESGAKVQKYIMVDQFGYRPSDDKVAVLADPQKGFNSSESYVPGKTFQVRRVSDDKIMYTGSPSVWNNGITEESSGDKGWWFDFSSVTEKGDYYIYDVDNNVKSYIFRISEDVYNDVLKAAIKTYYYQRMGIPHLKQYAGEAFTDGASYIGPHQDKEARNVFDRNNPATARDLSGGWMDAGDTDKYVTFTMEPINELLTAYETRPDIFSDDYNIPESGNGIPDILDEVKWELDWLKKMQESDGGVLLKVGFPNNGGIGQYSSPPSKTTAYRYYLPKCSSSTIVEALNFAHAALVLRKYPTLKNYADDLGARAVKAWNWYAKNPKSENGDNGEIQAGDADMTLKMQGQTATIASVYLFALTGNETYNTYFKNNYKSTQPLTDWYWGMYAGAQGDGIMFYTTLSKADPKVKADILNKRAMELNDHAFKDNDDLYRAYMPDWSYHWGSFQPRARLASCAYDFVQYDISKDKKDNFRKRAENILHYFHGVNPFNYVYLTNMGQYGAENSITQIFHTWFGDGTKFDYAPPGYIPGGPNASYSGTATPPKGEPRQKSYLDWNGVKWQAPDNFDKSWEITENAIYYQSAYIKLLSKFVASPPLPTKAPAAPSGLKAVVSGKTSIIVNWSKCDGASGYELEVDGKVINNGPAVAYTHEGLTQASTHHYRVRAKNNKGTSSWSSFVYVIIPKATTTH